GVRVFHLGAPVEVGERQHSSSTSGHGVTDLLGRMPNLEELHLLAFDVDPDALFRMGLRKLRVLRLCHGRRYPVELLEEDAAFGTVSHLPLAEMRYGRERGLRLPGLRAVLRSPDLKKLTHLQFRGSDAGDDGCKEIVRSGALKRLKSLDLRYGYVTDAGALTL